MALERRQLVELASSMAGFATQGWHQTSADELCLHFSLNLSVGCFEGALVYPNLFPDVPAYIYPRAHGANWSSHQYLGPGVFCLQYGPDNWHPGITGVDLVKSVNQLLWSELLRGFIPSFEAVPSRHNSTVGQNVRGNTRRFLSTAGLRTALAVSEATRVELKTVVTYAASNSVAVPTSLGAPIADIPKAFSEERYEWSGWAVSVPSVQALPSVATAASLKSILGTAWPWEGELSDQFQVLLTHEASGGVRVFALAGGESPIFYEFHVIEFGDDVEKRLPAEFTRLADVTVAIVGLGSLGSKLAVSLARTGVRRFILVDDDILVPGNLVRNELNWFDVGFSKVEAVRCELNRIAPGIEVQTRTLKHAGQENPKLAAALSKELSTCNLIIDATASPHAFVSLAALAKRGGVSMVWGEVFGGGVGAMMARSRPTLDADPLSIRSHVLGVMDTMAPVPNAKAKQYGVESERAGVHSQRRGRWSFGGVNDSIFTGHAVQR